MAKDFMKMAAATIQMEDSTVSVLRILYEVHAWDLPVIKDDRLIGFVSKSGILNSYRQLLPEYSDADN